MKHILRPVVGWIVCYIVLAIFMMDLIDALTMIAISVICTVGISLVIWIPLGYLVGWGVLALIGLFVKTGKDNPTNNPASSAPKKNLSNLTELLDKDLRSKPALTIDQQAIVNYIKKAQSKGLDESEINSNLRNNGWSADTIQWGLNYVRG